MHLQVLGGCHSGMSGQELPVTVDQGRHHETELLDRAGELLDLLLGVFASVTLVSQIWRSGRPRLRSGSSRII